MHPAYSVILFTTASGAGYGMLVLLAVLSLRGEVAPGLGLGLAGFGISLGLVSLGLLASTAHLGHPERAWRAFSQWRSSWLSREGVAAMLTYIPALIFAYGWIIAGRNDGTWLGFGVAAAVLALITVFSTGKIYASLRPIPRWNNRWVVPVYLTFALASGAVFVAVLLRLFGGDSRWLTLFAVLALFFAWLLKWLYWAETDRARPRSTSGTATGLGYLGPVRLFEAPNTTDSYVQREMGYRVARKHALKLRVASTLAGGLAAALLGLAQMGLAPGPSGGQSGGWAGTALVVLAALMVTLATVIERWLFFAEATHAVTLYYGEEEV